MARCKQCGKAIDEQEAEQYDGYCEDCYESQDYEYEEG